MINFELPIVLKDEQFKNLSINDVYNFARFLTEHFIL